MRQLRVLLLSFAIVLLQSSLAFAMPEGEHPTNWLDLAWRITTTALVVGVIWKLAGKKAVAFFSGRRTGIQQELHDLAERKEEARSRLADVEARIQNLESEREAILADYRARGEALHAEIIAKAEKDAAAVHAQARAAAQNEIDQAMTAMRAELADQIIAATEEVLRKKLSGKEQDRLLSAVLDKVVLQ